MKSNQLILAACLLKGIASKCVFFFARLLVIYVVFIGHPSSKLLLLNLCYSKRSCRVFKSSTQEKATFQLNHYTIKHET